MKVALITGSSRGIGKGIARRLAKENYAVVINYNKSEQSARELEEELSKITQVQVIKCDISNEQEVKEMIDKIKQKFGRIDVLVNNAGIAIDKLFQDRMLEDFKKTFDVNVNGTFLVSKYVGEMMMAQKSGSIINISSTNGINTYFPMCIDYDASKAAIISLTHNLAMQFAPYVKVNAIAPGFIGSESELEAMDEEFIEQEKEKILLKRIGTVEDVANLVAFLVSEDASFINNTVIRIDGGIYGAV